MLFLILADASAFTVGYVTSNYFSYFLVSCIGETGSSDSSEVLGISSAPSVFGFSYSIFAYKKECKTSSKGGDKTDSDFRSSYYCCSVYSDSGFS